MDTDLIQLFILLILLILGVPFYIFYRNRMVKIDGMLTVSYKRIIKVIWLNFFLNVLFSVYCYWVFISKFQSNDFIYLVIFIVLLLVVFYGNGIYITSILLTSYVEQFKPKTNHDIARDFLHWPVSHLIIYQSYFGLIGLFSFMPVNPIYTLDPIAGVFVVIIGGVIGLLFLIMHLYNTTLKLQLYSAVCILIGMLIAELIFSRVTMSYWLLFFMSTSLTFILCSICILRFTGLKNNLKSKLDKLS